MTISYPLNAPGPYSDIATLTMVAPNVVGMAESPFTYEQQVHKHQGEAWQMSVELNPLDRASAEPWIAWLLALNGKFGTFVLGDPSGATARGAAGGAPKVRTGSESAADVAIYAATGSATNWMRAGDYLQLTEGSTKRLHRILQDVNTTSGGVATIDIWPQLRTPPLSGSTVVVSSTVGTWRLLDNAASWTVTGPGIYRIAFTAKEALP